MATLTARKLVTATGVVDRPVITLDGERITAIASHQTVEETSITHDFSDCILTSGFLDIHIHGAAGHDVMEATSSALHSVSSYLARAGVTQYLATTVTASLDKTLRALEGIAHFVESQPSGDAARAVGIHIEGPFLSHAKRGMHPSEFLLAPSPDLLERFWEVSRGNIRMMTIAPEIPGALETIARAKELGIRSSMGHSNATQRETIAGIDAGASSATHTFNAMRPLDHREPGILGTVLDRDDLFADLICDGIHVSAEAVRLWFKAKGPHKAILITDCLEGAGMPEGTYKLGETVVHVKGSTCTTVDGTLAGSVMMLDQAVANLQQFTGADLPTAVRMASVNPARMLGLSDLLEVGALADFNVFNEQGVRTATMLRGRILKRVLPADARAHGGVST